MNFQQRFKDKKSTIDKYGITGIVAKPSHPVSKNILDDQLTINYPYPLSHFNRQNLKTISINQQKSDCSSHQEHPVNFYNLNVNREISYSLQTNRRELREEVGKYTPQKPDSQSQNTKNCRSNSQNYNNEISISAPIT